MTDVLEYKNYFATVHYNADDEVFHGKIIGINDLVSFEGTTVKELKVAFHEAVEDYLETCMELGKEPEKAYKGSFNVRIPPELHREAAHMASLSNVSLNDFIRQALSYFITKPPDKYSINSLIFLISLLSPAIFAGFVFVARASQPLLVA